MLEELQILLYWAPLSHRILPSEWEAVPAVSAHPGLDSKLIRSVTTKQKGGVAELYFGRVKRCLKSAIRGRLVRQGLTEIPLSQPNARCVRLESMQKRREPQRARCALAGRFQTNQAH